MKSTSGLDIFPSLQAEKSIQHILQEVHYLGENCFQLGDRLPEASAGYGSSLTRTLADRLYTTYYCRQKSLLNLSTPDTDLLPLLQQANTSKGDISRKWLITKVEQNNLYIVTRSNVIRHVYKDGLVLPHETLKKGSYVDLKTYKEDFTSQAGFYYFIGDTLGNFCCDTSITRLYLNIQPNYAPQWVHELTTQFNYYQIPFQGKILRFKNSYNRVETSVLYIPRVYINQAISLVHTINNNLGGLDADTPILTYPIDNGISIAENPPKGESYGYHRMSILADAIARSWHNNQFSPLDLMHSVSLGFSYSGLDVKKPWLNSRSADYKILSRTYSERKTKHSNSSIYLEAAEKIANQLIRDAIWDKDSCSWLDWHIANKPTDTRRIKTTLSYPVYDGTAGIALFMAYLYTETGNAIYKSVAAAANNHAMCNLESIKNIGFYSGLSGLLYTQATLMCLGIIPKNIKALLRIIDQIKNAILEDHDTDIINGRAGAILALIKVNKFFPEISFQALQCARNLANQLISLARIEPNGCSWQILISGKKMPLLGLSHGTSGIAKALYKLAIITKNTQYKETALKGIEFELHHFDSTHSNWPDWRNANTSPGESEHTFMCAWCHGAPGSALALSYFLKDNDKAFVITQKAIETIQKSLSNNLHSNSCLCHGTAGNAEILLELARIMDRPDLAEFARTNLKKHIELHYETLTWPTDAPDNGYYLGLMTGIAGVGYAYLRQHSTSLPSLLNID